MGHKESYKYLNLKILTQIILNIFTVAMGCLDCLFVCWSLTSLCHSNGHIETMPAREIMGCLEPRLAAEMNFNKTLKYQWTCGL